LSTRTTVTNIIIQQQQLHLGKDASHNKAYQMMMDILIFISVDIINEPTQHPFPFPHRPDVGRQQDH
jgi:hypothetical protein